MMRPLNCAMYSRPSGPNRAAVGDVELAPPSRLAPNEIDSGVTTLVGTERGPVPLAFLAAILNVYAVALVSPVTTWVVAVELNVRAACAVAPMYGMTTYAVIAEPLFAAGALHVTVA